MIIQLNDVYSINVGTDSFDVRKPAPTKKRPDNVAVLAYCTSLERALFRVIQYTLASKKTVTDLQGFLKEWKAVQAEFQIIIDQTPSGKKV